MAMAAVVGWMPPSAALIAVTGIPLLVLGEAFFGLIVSGSVVSYAATSIVAVIAPIIDVLLRSLASGNFDDARGYGIGTGLAIISIGLLGLFSAVRYSSRGSSRARTAAAHAG